MHLERKHNVTRTEAIRRIDTFLDNLMQRPLPAGVTIKDPTKTWSGDTMTFSLKAKKGFLSTTLAGTVRVDDHSITVDSDLPGLITTFVPESKIHDAFDKQFDMLFPA